MKIDAKLTMTIGFLAIVAATLVSNFDSKGQQDKPEILWEKYQMQIETNEEKAMGIDYEDVDVEELQDVAELGCVEALYPVSDEVPLDGEIQQEIQKLCEKYEVSYPLVLAIMERECHFKEEYEGEHVGLMQVSQKWCGKIANSLNVSMLDTLGSVEVGIFYLSKLLWENEGEPGLALMIYNMGGKAEELYRMGYMSEYARDILQKEEKWSEIVYGRKK